MKQRSSNTRNSSNLICCLLIGDYLGRSWAATTTEGLLIYSLDQGLVWDPYELDVEVTPEQLHRCLKDGDHTTALILAFRLNEEKLIQEAVESIPVKDSECNLICLCGWLIVN